MSAFLQTSFRFPRGHLFGMTVSNNATDPTNDLDIAAGECRDDANTEDIILTSAITKRLDVGWSVGTNQGGLDTGSIANTTYHVFVIKRLDTGVVDVLFSTSATSPTLPANYTKFRRILSIYRTGGSIINFNQNGNIVLRAGNIERNSALALPWSLITLSVPLGIKVNPILGAFLAVTTDGAKQVFIGNADEPESSSHILIESFHALDDVSNTGWHFSTTNTSGQINLKVTISGTLNIFLLYSNGWIDTRGKE